MAIVFPASPSVNDTFTAGSITYKWDGDKWIGLGVTPADRLIEGSNSLEITAGNDLVWAGDTVGIGLDPASDPFTSKLHVGGALVVSPNTTTHETIRFTTQGVDEGKIIMQDASNNEDVVINTGGNSWFNGGNVGIGTNNPDDKLHVLGNIVGRVTPKTFTINQGASNFGQVDTFSINADITRIYLNHSFTSTDNSTRTYTANITGGLPTALGSRIEVEVLSARTNNGTAVVGHQTVLQFNGVTILDSVYTTITYFSPGNVYSKKLIGTAILTSEGWKLDGVVHGRNLEITDGNIKFDSGHGIDFSATSDAAGMTSELLDDYEEGTFTPTITGWSGSYSIQYGVYTKIGRQVFIHCEVLTAGGTGSFTTNFPGVANLPFARDNTIPSYRHLGNWGFIGAGATIPANGVGAGQWDAGPGTTALFPNHFQTNGGIGNYDSANAASAFGYRTFITYFTAS